MVKVPAGPDSREGDGEGESLPQVDAHEGDVGDVVDCRRAPGSRRGGQFTEQQEGSRHRRGNNQFLVACSCRTS